MTYPRQAEHVCVGLKCGQPRQSRHFTAHSDTSSAPPPSARSPRPLDDPSLCVHALAIHATSLTPLEMAAPAAAPSSPSRPTPTTRTRASRPVRVLSPSNHVLQARRNVLQRTMHHAHRFGQVQKSLRSAISLCFRRPPALADYPARPSSPNGRRTHLACRSGLNDCVRPHFAPLRRPSKSRRRRGQRSTPQTRTSISRPILVVPPPNRVTDNAEHPATRQPSFVPIRAGLKIALTRDFIAFSPPGRSRPLCRTSFASRRPRNTADASY